MMGFPRLIPTMYQQLTKNAKVLKLRRDLPAILLTENGYIIKHIYKRGFLSSSRLWPYAARIISKSKKLQKKGIGVPNVAYVFNYPLLQCDLVIYPYIEGNTVFELMQTEDASLLSKAGAYIAHLHHQGIYFRDLHTSNLILSNNQISLIDIASIKLFSKPLSIRKRIKNLLHLFEKKEDQWIWKKYGIDAFLEAYLEHSKLDRSFLSRLQAVIPAKAGIHILGTIDPRLRGNDI